MFTKILIVNKINATCIIYKSIETHGDEDHKYFLGIVAKISEGQAI